MAVVREGLHYRERNGYWLVLNLLFLLYSNFQLTHLLGFGEPTEGGRDTIIGSRLVPRSTMENHPAAYMDALMFALEGSTAVLAHLVAGGQVAKNKELETSINPAWRTALAHVMFYHDLGNDVGIEARKAARVAMTAKVARLTSLAPESGAYTNEVCLHIFVVHESDGD